MDHAQHAAIPANVQLGDTADSETRTDPSHRMDVDGGSPTNVRDLVLSPII